MDFKNKIYITKLKRMEIKEGLKFQWIKSERIGDVEIVEEITDKKVHFESKRVLNKNVFEEFMKPIKSDDDLMIIQKAGDPSLEKVNSEQPKNPSFPVQQTTNPNDILISNSKIVDAINSSKKSRVLTLKTKVKYLDPALYEFLKDAHDNFDEVYREMIIRQVTEELKSEIDEFLLNIYNKD